MYKITRILLGSLLALLMAKIPAATLDAQAMVRAADKFRLPASASYVKTRILLYKNNTLDKERIYDVYLKSGHRSLVLFRHRSERGQKMLMLDDKFWLLMPKSRRPIRVTPMQKLLGEASAGDIASMTWSDDYHARLLRELRIDKVKAVELELTATRKGATYKRILLTVAQQDSRPLKAVLYLNSGKIAKRVSFQMGELDGRPAVVSMTLLDNIQKQKKTVINYLTIKPKSIADKYFNPMFLVRNTLDDL